jgi:hypothetical protein
MSSNSSSSSSVESYPPTLEDLRKSFLAVHPEYEFGILVFKNWAGIETKYHAPKEQIGGTSVWDDPCSDICHAQGRRFQEWINYIYNQTKLIATEANVTIALPKESELLPQRWTGDIFQPPPIQRLIRVEDAYFQLCHNPEVTPAKRFAREQARKAKIHMERKRKEKLAKAIKRHEEELAKTEKRRAIIRSKKISSLATKASLTEQEAEAVLAHLDPSNKFKKEALLALQVLNRFATEHKIRVEDAITVFREYI